MLSRDFAYAARALRNSPVFAVTAIITIALGIGASTAVFSVANAVLVRPLPYKNPERVVTAYGDWRKRNLPDYPFSNADYFDLRTGTNSVFEDMGAVYTWRAAVPKQDGSMEEIRLASVTPNFFRLMGAKIAFGRDLEDADGQPPPPQASSGGAQPAPAQATILSYEYWQRHFGGDTSILGRNAPGSAPGTTVIVGVLAPGFELLFPAGANVERAPDYWYAARIAYDNANRNSNYLRPIGRLRAGATLDAARAQAEVVAAEIRSKNEIRNGANFHVRLEQMDRQLVADVRPAVLALLGAGIFLLLVACANVANLLLVRTSLRARELAVRNALGGSRWHLVRQILAEAVLLAGLGTLLGVGLAWIGVHELVQVAPANLPRLDAVKLDFAVLAFAALAGLGAATIFGLPPALQASGADVMRVLRASGRTTGLAGGRTLRNTVVIVEIALSFVLLTGSGLMFRSFLALQRIDPGYKAHGLLTFQLLGSRGGNQPEQRAAFVRSIQDHLRALPGVESVTASTPFPLTGGINATRWGKEEALADPSKYQAADFLTVLPGYFETLQTRLIEGRTFTEADNSPDRTVAVIDQALAAKAFPHESAVGRRILLLLRNNVQPDVLEVIGVVAHQRDTSLAESGREQIYITDGFRSHGVVARWAVRTVGDPAKLAPAVRAEIAKISGGLLITEVQPMDALVDKAQTGTRFSLLLIGVFAMIAALLAGVGLHGVLSTVVRQRTAEIGVRLTLGSSPMGIVGLVAGHGLRLCAVGIAAGVISAFALTRTLSSMLVGVKATDRTTFALMAMLFFFIAAMASWLPARRAARLDPTAALREE